MIVSATNPPYITKRTWRDPLKPEPRRQKEFSLVVLELSESIKRNRYSLSHGDTEPMIFELHVTGQSSDDVRAYFRHTINFKRVVRNWGVYDDFDRSETDFIRIEHFGEPSEGGTISIKPKLRIGDTIRVKGLWEECLSRIGKPYLSLSRVHLLT